MLDVTAPPGGRLNAGQLHTCLRPPADAGAVHFDLRAAAWVEPVGLVMLAALADEQVRRGGTVTLVAPADAGIARYLARMRLGRLLDRLGQRHDLPPVRERDTGRELVELSRFRGEAEPDRLAELVFDKTSADLRVARALHQSIAELGVNVPQHSGLDAGYVAAQSTYNGSVVQFAVGDAGRGVAAGFTPVPPEPEALAAVLRGRSRTAETGRGRGLVKAQQLVLGLDGSLHMLSGTAYRTHHLQSQLAGTSTVRYPGTLLQGTFAVPTGVLTG